MVQTTAMGVLDTVVANAQTYVPRLFYVVVLLVVGYILGRITYAVVRRVLEHTRVDEYFQEEGHLELELSDLFAQLAKWLVYFTALQEAATLLAVPAFSELLQEVTTWIPDVITAIAIFVAGYGIAAYTKDQIIGSETLYADLVGKATFFFVLYIAVTMALQAANIPSQILNNVLLVIVASVGLAFAIAAGWGLQEVFREEAKRYIEAREE